MLKENDSKCMKMIENMIKYIKLVVVWITQDTKKILFYLNNVNLKI